MYNISPGLNPPSAEIRGEGVIYFAYTKVLITYLRKREFLSLYYQILNTYKDDRMDFNESVRESSDRVVIIVDISNTTLERAYKFAKTVIPKLELITCED